MDLCTGKRRLSYESTEECSKRPRITSEALPYIQSSYEQRLAHNWGLTEMDGLTFHPPLCSTPLGENIEVVDLDVVSQASAIWGSIDAQAREISDNDGFSIVSSVEIEFPSFDDYNLFSSECKVDNREMRSPSPLPAVKYEEGLPIQIEIPEIRTLGQHSWSSLARIYGAENIKFNVYFNPVLGQYILNPMNDKNKYL